MKNQSFDDRAKHLHKNIYGSDKGRLRLAILQRDLHDVVVSKKTPLRILDAGCGEGVMSEWALSHQHRVTACDYSAVMVDKAHQRLNQYVRSFVFHSDIQSFDLNEKYDVIFCHAVLEWIEDKRTVIAKLSSLLNPGGTLSLMFYNAWAREIAQLVYGNFDYIERGYAVKKRVKLNPHSPAFPDEIECQLKANCLAVKSRSGIRVFYDIMRDVAHQEALFEQVLQHELRVSQQHPYWQMGRYVHFLATKEMT